MIVQGRVVAQVAARPAEAGSRSADEPLLLADEGDHTAMIARLEPHDRPEEGSVVRLEINPAAVHLFDAATGERIGSHASEPVYPGNGERER